MIRLGDKVKDPITGFTGTVVARTTWLQGCARINIQPFGTDKDGKIFECQSFDEPQLVVIKAKTRQEKNRRMTRVVREKQCKVK